MPNDPDTSVEFETTVTQAIVPKDGVQLFLASVPDGFTEPSVMARIHGVWDRIWRDAGHAAPPKLLIVPNGMNIRALTDAGLRDMGLMRIPPEQAGAKALRDAVRNVIGIEGPGPGPKLVKESGL